MIIGHLKCLYYIDENMKNNPCTMLDEFLE